MLAQITTAGKVALSSLEIDGESNAVTALADGDLFIVDDGADGTNSKMACLSHTNIFFGEITGDVLINSRCETFLIQAGAVALGTDTTNNYVETIGAGNGIAVSGADASTGSTKTIALATNPDIAGTLDVTGVLTADSNLVVGGNVTAASATTISLGAGTSTTTVNDDLVVSGNLTVSGTTTTVKSTTVTIDDNLLKVADNNSGDATDFGFYGQYVESSTTKYAGLIRDNSLSGDPFVFFSGISGTEGTILGNNVTYTPGTHEAQSYHGLSHCKRKQ